MVRPYPRFPTPPALAGLLAATAALPAAALPAAAAEPGAYPRLSGITYGRIQADQVYRSSDQSREDGQVFVRATLAAELALSRLLTIRSTLKIEPVRRLVRDRVLDDQGAWMEEFYVALEGERFGVHAGKFDPTFGFAFDKAPVMFGRRLVEGYETTEMIGAGGRWKVADGLGGRHALVASAFFADSTVLSQSVLTRPGRDDPFATRPGRLRRGDGGPANTSSLESFTVAVTGADAFGRDGLAYTIGYRRQRQGAGDRRDEDGWVAGVEWRLALGEDLTLTPLAEFATLTGFEGDDVEARFLTGAATLEWGPWLARAAATLRRLRGAADSDDHLVMATVGYRVTRGMRIEIGWKTERINGIRGEAVGALVGWRYRF